jgi:hypothetical protein
VCWREQSKHSCSYSKYANCAGWQPTRDAGARMQQQACRCRGDVQRLWWCLTIPVLGPAKPGNPHGSQRLMRGGGLTVTERLGSHMGWGLRRSLALRLVVP